MHISNICLSSTVGIIVGGAIGFCVANRLSKMKMEEEISKRVIEEVEAYKRSLDEAANGIISMDDARKLVMDVQNELKEGESDTPVQSFSSLDETPEKEGEPESYNNIYDRYNDTSPSQLFNYDDDIPKDVIDNTLDIEAEKVIQSRADEIERFEEMMAERESPEEDLDPEVRTAKRKELRRQNKRVQEITDDDFFNQNRDYDKETLLFYKKDGVLCFENEEVVLDKEELLGPNFSDWLNAFRNTKVTSEKGKSLYLRSDFLHTDYEVIIYAGSYEHFVGGPEIR